MVVELHAYADESGGTGDDPYCAIAGFIASERQWKIFRPRWREALGSVPAFHATDFWSRAGWKSKDSPYHGWTSDKALRFQRGLISVFYQQDKRLNPTNAVTNIPDFSELSEDWQRISTGALIKWSMRDGKFSARLSGTGKPSAPWFVSFIDLVQRIVEHVPDGAVLHLWFDEQNEYAPLAQITWKNMKRHKAKGWRKMGDLTFACDEEYEPLQLADMYTYLVHHYVLYGDDGLGADRAEALAAFARVNRYISVDDRQAHESRVQRISEEILGKIAVHYGHGE
ncbi:MAG: DUF3800 domain-containing protein [Dehalococcoidia bacterium]|nr:DUF3800 domain-containing protein [Dehalococcoidia bacterium]